MSAYTEWLASGGPQYLIETLEIKRDSTESLFYCAGYEDVTATDENGREITFIASPLQIALRKTDNSGSQAVTFGFQNVTSEVQQYVDAAIEADEQVRVIYRCWLSDDLSAPADVPLNAIVTDAGIEGDVATVETQNFGLVDTNVWRDKYVPDKYPGIRYAQ